MTLALVAGGIGTLDVDLKDRVARRDGLGAALFGMPAGGSLEHEEWLRLLHPEDRADAEAAFAAMLREGCRYDVEYRIRHKGDTAPRWIAVRATPLLDAEGRPYRLVGVIQDVTAQKEAEAALRASEHRLRLAQRAAGVGSYDWLIDAEYATVSDEYVAIHGLPPGTERDTFEAWSGRLHPGDRAQATAAFRAAFAGAPFDIEFRIIRPSDGAVRVLASRAEIFTDSGSPARRMIGAVRDVTERRRNEAELRHLNEELELRVREEVAAREATQQRLAQSERMQALGQLAGGIAHDFNNVLQAIQGAAVLIERRPADADGIRRLARLSLDAVERGASVTRRLLSFSRRGDLRAAPVDAATLLADLREMLAHSLGAEIVVRLDIAQDLPPLMADKGQLETALVNLAVNARDAMPSGGTLTFSAAERPGPSVRITVSDDGIGMDAATLARASEPFFTTKPVHKGTGLGLAMARGFAEQSGGGMHIQSASGAGTSVTLWFPIARDAGVVSAERARAPVMQTDPATGARRRLLLVDDEIAVRQTLGEQLEGEGYSVVQADGGAAAIDLLSSGERFDLIVCDLSMPGQNGIAVLRAVHRLHPGLPAILLTGYAGDEASVTRSGGLEAPFTLLRKPVEGRALADRIAALLALSRAASRSGGAHAV